MILYVVSVCSGCDFFHYVDRRQGILGIVVGTDVAGDVFSNDRTSDNHGTMDAGIPQVADTQFHGIDCRCHQCAEPDCRRTVLAVGFGDGFLVNVFAQVDDTEAVAFQYHFHDIFADIVDVAFDGGKNYSRLLFICRISLFRL